MTITSIAQFFHVEKNLILIDFTRLPLTGSRRRLTTQTVKLKNASNKITDVHFTIIKKVTLAHSRFNISQGHLSSIIKAYIRISKGSRVTNTDRNFIGSVDGFNPSCGIFNANAGFWCEAK